MLSPYKPFISVAERGLLYLSYIRPMSGENLCSLCQMYDRCHVNSTKHYANVPSFEQIFCFNNLFVGKTCHPACSLSLQVFSDKVMTLSGRLIAFNFINFAFNRVDFVFWWGNFVGSLNLCVKSKSKFYSSFQYGVISRKQRLPNLTNPVYF